MKFMCHWESFSTWGSSESSHNNRILFRFFEVRTTTAYYTDLGVNVTDVGPTPLRNNPAYVSVYMTWLYLVVMYFLPFVGLTGFNLFIYKQV